jgi:sulfoxide reductase catalytic subunit YedY
MLIKRPRGWDLPESAVTSEHVYRDRRRFLKGLAGAALIGGTAGTGLLAGGDGRMPRARADDAVADPSAGLYPVPRNETFQVDRPLTSEETVTTYNNFYEFGSHKRIYRDAQDLQPRPWTVKIDGMVEKPVTIGIDDLLAKMPLEERYYRLRCVEAWSMVIPWSGFPLAKLVEFAKPLSGAKYLEMVTFMDPDVASEQRKSWYPWPYTEGLTMAEATNELAFIATGVYGKPLPPQNGTPLRLAVPWKYGFKNVKSIVSFTFTDQRPVGFWQDLQASEYGFWANVNPDVPHPRWSQAMERDVETGNRLPTRIFNGYGEYVAGIYKGIEGEQLFR